MSFRYSLATEYPTHNQYTYCVTHCIVCLLQEFEFVFLGVELLVHPQHQAKFNASSMRRPWLSPCSIWILRAASLSGLGFFLKVCSRQKCRARSPCEFDWGFPRGHRALRRGPSPSYRTVQVACLRVSRALSWRPVHLAARPTATGLAAKLAKIVILRRPRYTVHSTDSWTDPAARGGGGGSPHHGKSTLAWGQIKLLFEAAVITEELLLREEGPSVHVRS